MTTLIAPAFRAAGDSERFLGIVDRVPVGDAAAVPVLVQHADILAEVGSDDGFEVGLNGLIA